MSMLLSELDEIHKTHKRERIVYGTPCSNHGRAEREIKK